MDTWIAISSDGQLTPSEMLKELQEYRIAPIMTFNQDDKRIVPLFKHKSIAERFAQRNTNRSYTIGTMIIIDKELELLINRGFEPIIFEFPIKRDIIIEVIELDREVQTANCGTRSEI